MNERPRVDAAAPGAFIEPVDARAGESGARGRVTLLIDGLLLLLALYLPCRFLWPLNAGYYVDWWNHEWAVGYFGEFFRVHQKVPAAFNTRELGGLALPVFYGNLFYPILGALSALLSPAVAIRAGAVVLFAAQYCLVAKALLQIRAPRHLARVVACLVTWAVYPLSNLYNRGAVTEFFATGLLTCALSLLVLFFHASNASRRRVYASAMMLCLTLSAGTHPITALYGVPLFLAIGVLFFVRFGIDASRRKSLIVSVLPWAVLSLVCVAPWLYATARYSNHLTIRHSSHEVIFFPNHIDRWLTRFFPIAHDPRAAHGIINVETVYLDAQVNVPLLLLLLLLVAIALTGRGRAKTPAAALALISAFFAFFTLISLVPASYRFLPEAAKMIQFAYRAISYQNLTLLLGVFLIAMVADLGKRLRHPGVLTAALACWVLSLIGVVVKGSHIMAIQTLDGSPSLVSTREERESLVDMPTSLYELNAYAAEDLFVPLDNQESKKGLYRAFDVAADHQFGFRLPIRLQLPEATWVATNVHAFPWNLLAVDGTTARESEVHVWDRTLAVFVPAGNHQLSVGFSPDPLWQALRTVSLLSLCAWCLQILVGDIWSAAWRRGLWTDAHGFVATAMKRRRLLVFSIAMALAALWAVVSFASPWRGYTWQASSAMYGWHLDGTLGHSGTQGLILHTLEEDNPWIVVDMAEPRSIHEIVVKNRVECCWERGLPLVLEVAERNGEFTQVGRRTDVFKDEWRVTFPNRRARYVRVRSEATTILQIRRIEIR